MTPAELWNAGLQAAAKLSRVPGSRVLLGAALSVDELHELARLAGEPVRSHLGILHGPPIVIEYFCSMVGECELAAQTGRPATEADIRDAQAAK